MTIDKAVDLIDNLYGMINDNQGNDYDTAFKMAIEALKQPKIKYLEDIEVAETVESCTIYSGLIGLDIAITLRQLGYAVVKRRTDD